MAMEHHPVDVLLEEHEIILQVLTAIDYKSRRLAAGTALDRSFWDSATDFIVNFAERRHEAKEEEVLIPAMIASGFVEHEEPIAMISREHIRGRDLALTMRHACGRSEPGHLAEAAREFTRLMRAHIEREDTELLPKARQALDSDTVARVWEKFIAIDRGAGSETDYATVALRLCELAEVEFVPPGVIHHG